MMAESDGAVTNTSRRAQSPSNESQALAWFVELQRGDAGVRARLRRARSRVDVLMEPKAIQLAQRVGRLSKVSRASDEEIGEALDLARVLAHVKMHDGERRVMQQAGWQTFVGDRRESDAGKDAPALSGIRFRRLLTTDAGEPLVAAFVRLVRQLDGTVNVHELSWDFLNWSHPLHGARVRSKWAFDYFAAGTPASIALNTSTHDEGNS